MKQINIERHGQMYIGAFDRGLHLNVILKRHDDAVCGDDCYPEIANEAITAHRKALSDARWVEAPKVKLTKKELSRIYRLLGSANGDQKTVEYLQSLGLSIESED